MSGGLGSVPSARGDKYASHDSAVTIGAYGKRWSERLSIGMAIAGWFTFSLASLFLAKHVLHTHKINEGVFTLWQFSASVLFGGLFTKVFRVHPLANLNRAQLRKVVPLSAAFLIKEMLKYASLARVSVNLVNTIRSLGPIFNVVLEALFFAHRPPPRVLWALAPIVVGVALTSFDELQSASLGVDLFTAALGFSSAVLSTAINNGQNIYSKILFGKERIDPVSLQIYLSGISLIIMAPGSALQFLHHVFMTDLPKRHWFAPSLEVALIMGLAGFVNFVSSQLAFNTLSRISPLSYSVANTFKRVCIACLAIFYLGERLSLVNGLGIAVSISGVFVYERVSRAYRLSRMYHRIDNNNINSPRPIHRHTGSEERLDMLDLGSIAPPSRDAKTNAISSSNNNSAITGFLSKRLSSPNATPRPPKYPPQHSPSTRLTVDANSPSIKLNTSHLLSAKQ